MAKKQTVSDAGAKDACIHFLRKQGYSDLRIAKRGEHCDIVGKIDDRIFYFEVKYSSKDSGKFFGTVMLTELYHALQNKENYRFIVCRGNTQEPDSCFFRLFDYEEFIEYCTLTTPIFHYHLDFLENNTIKKPKFEEATILASDNLIHTMWNNFLAWKQKKKI